MAFVAFLRNLLFSLLLAGLGAYVLRTYPGPYALAFGLTAILAALGVAFPTQMHDASVGFKANVIMLLPLIVGALKGGDRPGDPPADASTPPLPRKDDPSPR